MNDATYLDFGQSLFIWGSIALFAYSLIALIVNLFYRASLSSTSFLRIRALFQKATPWILSEALVLFNLRKGAASCCRWQSSHRRGFMEYFAPQTSDASCRPNELMEAPWRLRDHKHNTNGLQKKGHNNSKQEEKAKGLTSKVATGKCQTL